MNPDTALLPITTVIIDDNRQARYLIKEILESDKDIRVCGEAESMQEAMQLLAQWKPEIIIFDILLGEYQADGYLTEISKMGRESKVIILSAHSEAQLAEKCLNAGASGYVCKDKAVRCLVTAIREVHSGKSYVSSIDC